MGIGIRLKCLSLVKFGTIKASKNNKSNGLHKTEFKKKDHESIMILKRERGKERTKKRREGANK